MIRVPARSCSRWRRLFQGASLLAASNSSRCLPAQALARAGVARAPPARPRSLRRHAN